MVLILFYSIAITFGYTLLFLFRKYYENKKLYYTIWAVMFLMLCFISPIMNESIFYIFEIENYENLNSWIQILIFIFIIIPAAFILYPLVLMYRFIFAKLEELFYSIMLLFVPYSKKGVYTKIKKNGSGNLINNEKDSNNDSI